MTQFRLTIGVEENLRVKVEAGEDPQAIFTTINTMERATTRAIVLLLGKNVVNVAKTIISRLSADPQIGKITANIGPNQKGKRDFMRWMKRKES